MRTGAGRGCAAAVWEGSRRIAQCVPRASGRARTPIIALTADAMSHQRQTYEAAEMDGFVAKPIEVAQLYAALEAALSAAPAPSEQRRAS